MHAENGAPLLVIAEETEHHLVIIMSDRFTNESERIQPTPVLRLKKNEPLDVGLARLSMRGWRNPDGSVMLPGDVTVAAGVITVKRGD